MAGSKIRFFIVLLICMFIGIASAQSQPFLDATMNPARDVIAVYEASTVKLYTPEFVLIHQFSATPITDAAGRVNWSPNGNYLAVSTYLESGYGTTIWDLHNLQQPFQIAEFPELSKVAWNSDNERIAGHYFDHETLDYWVQVHNIFSGLTGEIKPIPPAFPNPMNINALFWVVDSNELVLVDTRFHRWDVSAFPADFISTIETARTSEIPAYNSSRNTVTFADYNSNSIHIWQMGASPTFLRSITGHMGGTYRLAWRDDRIASTGYDNMTRVWSADTGAEIWSTETGIVSRLDWSSDGNELLVTGGNETPHIRDAVSGAILAEMCENCVQSYSSGS
jgi:WD40 repeat protein